MRESTSDDSNTHRADEHGLAALVGFLDLLHDGGELVAARLENGSLRSTRMQGWFVGMTCTERR